MFNEEGEQNVTTVDIAHELDISPGNLYYHFKGKDSIIQSLFDDFEQDMNELCCAKAVRRLNIRDQWFYIYVIFEQIHRYRFLYLNLTDILQRLPNIEKRFKRLITLKQNSVLSITKVLSRHKLIRASEYEQQRLAETVTMTLIYWFPYQLLSKQTQLTETLIHTGVNQIMSLFGPYLDGNQKEFYHACQELYEYLVQPK